MDNLEQHLAKALQRIEKAIEQQKKTDLKKEEAMLWVLKEMILEQNDKKNSHPPTR